MPHRALAIRRDRRRSGDGRRMREPGAGTQRGIRVAGARGGGKAEATTATFRLCRSSSSPRRGRQPITRAAYEFAARHPEVLKHVPCFCGCERNGHGNNEDCFVARRKADGSPEWSPHGIGCGICIDVAVAARAAACIGRERGRHPARD